MLDSARVSSVLKGVVVLGILIWSLSFLGGSTTYKKALRPFRGEKDRFIEDFLEHEIDGPFDGEPIASLCANKTWTKGLIFMCDPPPGGIGEVGNAHLNCIRLAMEAGAELIVPEIVRRSEKNIAQLFPDSKATQRGVGLDYYFDKQHFNRSMATFCPQMRLHWSLDDLYDTPMGNPLPLSVEDLGVDRDYETIVTEPETWEPSFKEYFEAKTNPKLLTWPFRVNVGLTLYAWPTSYDRPDFVRNFGRILRVRNDAKQLAASAMLRLQKIVKAQVSLNSKKGISKGYVGLHLRTEKDVQDLGFPPYEEQAAWFFDYMMQSKYTMAYLASGSTAQEIRKFTERAQELDITVLTKKDLLDPEELQYLSRLSWDQQALVDYELMLRANLTAGVSDSSFTWNIALRRASAAGSVGGKTMIPATGHVRWQDKRSVVMGKEEEGNMNMQLGIWP